MPQRHSRDDPRRSAATKHLNVASKCLAIVLLPQKKHGKPSASHDVNKAESEGTVTAVSTTAAGDYNSTVTASHTTRSGGLLLPNVGSGDKTTVSGKEILDDFKRQNQTCYWNPALIESIRQLDYLGFVEPCTVLVSGEDIHLENLRSAWGRRVLKAPTHYSIDRIGDVNGIEMQVIPQTQFIPLPDSLCLIITELNGGSQPATLETIRGRLQRWYSNTNLPSHQLIYDTLGQLIRERKVFHNGNGYCVVTPEMYHVPATADPSLACTASWLPYHPMYIPVFPPQQQQPPYRAPTRSISCQVTQIEDKQSSEGSHQAEKKKSRPRSHSVRMCRGKEKAAQAEKENTDFRRSSSARFKTEKAKAMSKDLNLKSSNINQEKDKGEKVSLFSKIFGRKKKSTSAATISTSSGGGNQSTETEFVTFSAQFPPPEWLWYQQQLERQRRTEEWVTQQLPKSATWGSFGQAARVPSSGVVERGSLDTALTESSQLYTHCPMGPNHHHHLHHQQQQQQPAPSQSQRHVYASLAGMAGMPAADGVRGASTSAAVTSAAEERRMKQQYRLSGSQSRKSHNHHHHHHKHRDHRKTLHDNNYDVPAATYAHFGGGSGVGVGVGVGSGGGGGAFGGGNAGRVDPSPYSLEEDNIYSTPGPTGQYAQFTPWHSTPCYDVPPDQFDGAAMPSNIIHSNTTQQEPSDAGKVQSSHASHHQRRAHRSKRRGHKAYSLFDASSAGNDISIEYKGRMPKKNSSVAQSRDSGVNCIGLPQSRQRYLEEEPDLHVTQEASAYLPSRVDQPTISNTATASSLQPDTLSTQRGTPYNSMDQREPEGCSQSHRQPLINAIINPISPSSVEMGSGRSADHSDNATHRDHSGRSGASTGAGGEEREQRGGEGEGTSEGGLARQQQGQYPHAEDRSEGEGLSHHDPAQYMMMMGPDSSTALPSDLINPDPNHDLDPNHDPDNTPHYVAMSYCDSSMGEDGAGGGEVFLCQAEINQLQIPQLVLDTESRLDCGNLSCEPDIALSSAGSKDTLDRTADESERSAETVIRSPQFVSSGGGGSQGKSAPTHRRSDLGQGQITSSRHVAQQEDFAPHDSQGSAAKGAQDGYGEVCAVSALGTEFKEMGVVDSGFSSPRNNDNNKENQQQEQLPQQSSRGRKTPQAGHPQAGAHTPDDCPEASHPSSDHRSKHERIKAFVKQSNEILEQRQFTSFAEHDNCAAHPAPHHNHHPHLHPHSQPQPLPQHQQLPHPHQQIPHDLVSRPLHPAAQHQQQQPQPAVLNNQRQHHHHHHHHNPRPQSVHAGLKERPKSQNVWPGQGQVQGQGHGGDKLSPNDLKAFQEKQLKGKKFGLNGEFEVVGIV